MFTNPLKEHGADPWMAYVDGWYCLATTTGRSVELRRAKHLAELANAKDEIVWRDPDRTRFSNVWAPEFHELPGEDGRPRWFLYYTANDGKDDTAHRMYVAESATEDIRGPYTFKARLQTDPDNAFYAIDGTVLKRPDGSLYFVWCGRPSETGQGLYISRMANPWTLEGKRTYLPASGFGVKVVREGPETLQRNGRVFLVYSSAPADTPDYKLGMLVAQDGADLLDPKNWRQHPTPVFQRDDAAGVYGPGHNFFFTSPDGKEDWIVYHAKSGTAHTYRDRSTRAQKFTWNSDGTPDFGTPAPTSRPMAPPSGE